MVICSRLVLLSFVAGASNCYMLDILVYSLWITKGCMSLVARKARISDSAEGEVVRHVAEQ